MKSETQYKIFICSILKFVALRIFQGNEREIVLLLTFDKRYSVMSFSLDKDYVNMGAIEKVLSFS